MKLIPPFASALRNLIFAASFFVSSPELRAQGDLTPPAGPTPTMKTLDQVEPRIDINKLTGDGTTVAIINAPGSYFLSANLAGAAGKDIIRVTGTGRVTIDLRGFALIGTATDRAAIVVPATNESIVIRNGTIFANSGGTTTRAISGGNNVTCEDVTFIGSGGLNLIALGTTSAVRRCRLSEGGISAADGASVLDTIVTATSNASIGLGTDSSVVGVKFATGRGELRVGDRGQISDCQVNAVGPPTIFGLTGNVIQTGNAAVVRRTTISAGTVAGNAIGVGSGSLVEGCRVLSAFREGILSNLGDNVTVVDSSVQGNGRNGISLGDNARVRDCAVLGSGANGIVVGDNSEISGCTISGV